MAVISGYHVDDYCVPAFKSTISKLVDQLGAVKLTEFAAISPGDLVAAVPPKIRSDSAKAELVPIPVFRIKSVGTDFADDGSLVRNGDTDYLYFEVSEAYLLDLNSDKPRVEPATESYEGAINCFDARQIGQLKPKHDDIDDELKGTLYRIPTDRLPGIG